MNIHNIFEEQVLLRVGDTYEQLKKMNTPWLTCDCKQCRLDTAAYVLNKIPPKYIVSGRGLTHSASDANIQLAADMDTLILDGMKRVASTARPFHTKNEQAANEAEQTKKGPVFNFPAFIGFVYNGLTFEPIQGALIKLLHNGKSAIMADHTWTNPVVSNIHTKGAYSFWVKPEKAQKLNEIKTFYFKIEITCDGYEKAEYAFDLPLNSCESVETKPNTTYSVKLQDLYLFPQRSI